jgi:DNA-binding PadR family transcriptional regulator
MSVRQGLLALLAEQPMHTYQLRQRFEARTGGTWPLNIGQVYTTVQRLVRDGLVEPLPGGADPEQYHLTDAGRAEVAAWWATPVDRGEPARDELVIKLALAVSASGVDVRDVVQRQRTASMRALHEYTRLKAGAGSDELAWSLVLDNLVFAAEAEVRWLDHVEARVARAGKAGPAHDEGVAAGAAPAGTSSSAAEPPRHAGPSSADDDSPRAARSTR